MDPCDLTLAKTRAKEMVARDGIEPPPPAFSGLDSATVILLTLRWLSSARCTIYSAVYWRHNGTKISARRSSPQFHSLDVHFCSIRGDWRCRNAKLASSRTKGTLPLA